MISHTRTAYYLDASMPVGSYAGRAWRICWVAALCLAGLPIPVLQGFSPRSVHAAEHTHQIRLAIFGRATGPQRLITRAIEAGARAAIASRGSPDLFQFEVLTADDRCNAELAQEKARELVTAGVDLVLGHPCAKAAVAASDIYAKAGVIFIATHTRHPALTATPRAGIVMLDGRDNAQGDDAARLLLARAAGKPIAIVHDRTQFASSIAGQAVRRLRANGSAPIELSIKAGEKDFQRQATLIKDAGAVLFSGLPMEAGFLATDLKRAGSTTRLIATDTASSPELAASFPDIAPKIDVLLAVDRNDEVYARAALEIFIGAYLRAVGPFQDHWQSDTATQRALVAYVLAKAGPHVSSIGPIRFNTSGDADVASFRLMRWDNDKWVPAKVSP